MVALVGLRDQFVDLAVGDLRQNAVAFADGQQDRIQHGVDAAHDLGIRALELLRLAAVGELPFLRSLDQPRQFLLQALHDHGHVVDRQLHLLVIALVGLGDQFVDLAAGDLRQDAVAFADGQQDRVQHLVDALNHLAMHAVEQRCLAALGQAPFLGCVHQAHDLLQHQHRVVFLVRPLASPLAACVPFIAVAVSAMPVAGPCSLPAFTYHCCSP